jgi:hypothetical protein
MSPREPLVNRVRVWSFAHPRVRSRVREVWGGVRRAARALRLPAPFDPPEFGDLRAVASTVDRDAPPGHGPTILFLSMRGWSTHLLWETTLARAAGMRGARPVFFTCGGRLPICDVANVHAAPPMPCVSCRDYAETALDAAGFDSLMLHDLIDVKTEARAARGRIDGLTTVAACEAFEDEGFPLGRLVRISVAWFLARGSLPENSLVLTTYRDFLVSGQVLRRAFAVLLDRVRPDQVFMLNGTFFPESILAALATHRTIPFTTYEKGFMNDTLVLTHGRAAVDFEIEDSVSAQAMETPLTAAENEQLDDYLAARIRGERTLDKYWPNRIDDADRIRTALRLKPGRSLVSLFSNILWDSAIQNKDLAFDDMAQWIVETIAGFAGRADTDLVVRLHPAEVRLTNHKTTERMQDVIDTAFPVLPDNVRIIPPDSPLSSYTLADISSLGLVYTSTIGLEMALGGVAVVVAAQTHYRGKGFTFDVATPEEYWDAIDRILVSPPSSSDLKWRTELARRYANLFFFRFTHHIDLVHEEVRGHPRLRFRSVDDLLPGRHRTLDLVVDNTMRLLPVVAPRVSSA